MYPSPIMPPPPYTNHALDCCLGGAESRAEIENRHHISEKGMDEGSVLFGMTGLEVEKPVAGFSLPMEFRTESSTRALLFTQQREASVATADS